MPGSSCEHCIFSQFQDSNQIGCLFGRTEKYHSVDILRDDMSSTYKVLIENICTTKRGKDFLQKHPRNPEKVVRQEIFPKAQLFLLINSLTSEWVDFFANTDLSIYSAVDICLFRPESEYIKSIGYLINQNNIFIHACFGEADWTINHFVRKDCQYYALFSEPRVNEIISLPNRLDYYVNDLCKPLVMIRPSVDRGNDNGLTVSTYMHYYVGGYGTQSVEEKICIDCTNNDNIHMIIFDKDFNDATTTNS